MIEKDFAKSSRTKCNHCEFMGKTIPKGNIRYKVLTAYELCGKVEGVRFYLCEHCGLKYLKNRLTEIQALIPKPRPIYNPIHEEIPF